MQQVSTFENAQHEEEKLLQRNCIGWHQVSQQLTNVKYDMDNSVALVISPALMSVQNVYCKIALQQLSY
jgi:hypothetical protein